MEISGWREMMKRNVIIYKDPAKQADSRIPGSEASLGKREKERGMLVCRGVLVSFRNGFYFKENKT